MEDAEKQLKLPKLRNLKGNFGELPDLKSIDFKDDVIFTFNGTTSGHTLTPIVESHTLCR